MKKILIVTKKEKQFTEFIKALKEDDIVSNVRTVSPETVLENLTDPPPSLVVIDEKDDGTPGLSIAREILMKNAMIHQALVSGMSEQEFHDTAEGLGVIGQLPSNPDAAEAKILIEALKKLA